MKKRMSMALFLFSVSYMMVVSCNKGNNETNISSYSSSKSHNMGQNCMNCHKSGGEGEGWFNVAGTVYDSSLAHTLGGGTVKLYTGPGGTGTLKYTVQVDTKGNFYTTESIDFGSGLYPAVQGTSNTHYMSTSISTGQCNSCHGVNTSKIWTN